MNFRSLLSDVRIRCALFAAVILVLPGCEGCQKKDPIIDNAKPIGWSDQLPPGKVALRLCRPEEIPDFSPAYNNLRGLLQAVEYSLQYLAHPSSKMYYPYKSEPPITHEQAQATLRCFWQILSDCASRKISSGEQLNSVIREKFLVYISIGAPNPEGEGYTDKVLFTGYCTPIYDASMTRTGEFQWPLYKRPDDLLSDKVTGNTTGRKTPDGQVVPYWTREEIEKGGKLAGKELVYLKSRFEAYVVTVQGSARLRLPDGQMFEIGYAGYNGYDYTSPAKAIQADGVIKKEDYNLKNLKAYFAANPAQMDKYLNLNKRYVFFTPRPGGPFGCLNVPVTPMRTIATDKEVYPRAMAAFLNVQVPWNESGAMQQYQGFMMDQDAGGAIRASGRSDIFMGIGEAAEKQAGYEMNVGQLYYLAIKPDQMGQYSTPLSCEKKTGPNQAAVVPEGPGGSKDVTGGGSVRGPDTSKLPKKDTKGPPPPGGWPKPKQ